MAPTRVSLEPKPQLGLRGIHILIWCVFGVSTIAFVVRIYSRLKHFRKLFSDDWAVCWAWLFLLGYCIVGHLIAPFALSYQGTLAGIAKSDPNYENRTHEYYQLEYAQILIFITSLYSIKLSFMLFFWRLSEGSRTIWTHIYWWTTLAITVLAYIGAWVSQSMYCHAEDSVACSTPFRLHNAVVGVIYSYAADIGTDVLIIGFPIHLLWGVQIPWKRKIILFSILCAGALIVAVSLGRAAALGWGKNSALDRLIFWGDIELGIAFVVCSLAAYSSFFAGRAASGSPAPLSNHDAALRHGSGSDLEAKGSKSDIVTHRHFNVSNSTLKKDEVPEIPVSSYRGIPMSRFDKDNQNFGNNTTVESADGPARENWPLNEPGRKS